ncbi:GTPase [Methylomarinovum caldicuralii]|uniref:GTPase Der n=1 Tax=Methylomarinovum caldicuralii TaxID=438856 RepID=A0AAU9CPH8_9GAMM|nr:ribosome biogenesis GTPase Der [Methylomarinovum caldicuralii]BCX81878.1 GTPase [Methylomarinovum caldicuralii]
MNKSLPVVALVGRPNVGKSTLFNWLTQSRDALVADYPGLTRDRHYGRCRRGSREFLVVDTGGVADTAETVDQAALRQVEQALEEADLILFLVDAREGLTAADEDIAARLRRLDKPVLLVINKIDGEDPALAAAEFSVLGFAEPVMIAAAHGRGTAKLLARIEALLPPAPQSATEADRDDAIRVAVIGRPNVGKSTLVNRLLGEERVVVADHPGTTRDAIEIPFERDGRAFVLIDTAGIRRRARVEEAVEKFSVIKAIQAMEQADVVVFLIDASEGITDQDARLLGMVLEAGKALIIGLNKWDGLSREQKQKVRGQLETRLQFVDFAEKLPISALHGTGVGDLFDRIAPLYEQAQVEFGTSELTRILQDAVISYPPPLVRGRRIKLKFAHQGGKKPPLIVIHGNQTERVPASYRRYLNRSFREALGIKGTPLQLEFRSSANPFAGRRNKLTPRQLRKRQRLLRHAKKGR